MTMRRIFTVLPLVFACAALSTHAAQGQTAGPKPGSATRAESPAAPAAQTAGVDASRLPVNVDRIARQLRATRDTERFVGNRLEYQLSVYALSPVIRVFAPGENQTTGPVRDSAPAHREFIDFWSGWKRGRR